MKELFTLIWVNNIFNILIKYQNHPIRSHVFIGIHINWINYWWLSKSVFLYFQVCISPSRFSLASWSQSPSLTLSFSPSPRRRRARTWSVMSSLSLSSCYHVCHHVIMGSLFLREKKSWWTRRPGRAMSPPERRSGGGSCTCSGSPGVVMVC